jgi:hypothetical protein
MLGTIPMALMIPARTLRVNEMSERQQPENNGDSDDDLCHDAWSPVPRPRSPLAQ